jgi:hypothetical protein
MELKFHRSKINFGDYKEKRVSMRAMKIQNHNIIVTSSSLWFVSDVHEQKGKQVYSSKQ